MIHYYIIAMYLNRYLNSKLQYRAQLFTIFILHCISNLLKLPSIMRKSENFYSLMIGISKFSIYII
jgi:hypothetical protein